MRSNQEQVLKWLALSEGGYVNHPKDPGGATNLGVTQRVYTNWLRLKGRPTQSVRNITKAEAEEIFVEQYFAPVKFNDLPAGLDYAMADYSANSGPSRAVTDLQRVLVDLGHKMATDGHMGIVTMAAVAREPDAGLIISALCRRRMAFLKRLSTFSTFGVGWTRRVMGEIDGIQAQDTGVIDRAMRMSKSMPQVSEPREAPGKASPEPDGLGVLISKVLEIIMSLFGGRS